MATEAGCSGGSEEVTLVSVHAPAPVATPRPPARPTRHLSPIPAAPPRHRLARLHLLTYLVGNAVFWMLWAAISVSADHWYWWPIVPLVGWTVLLGVHVWRALEGPR